MACLKPDKPPYLYKPGLQECKKKSSRQLFQTVAPQQQTFVNFFNKLLRSTQVYNHLIEPILGNTGPTQPEEARTAGKLRF